MSTTTYETIQNDLQTRSVKDFLKPLMSALGGVPGASTLPRKQMVKAILDAHPLDKIVAAMTQIAPTSVLSVNDIEQLQSIIRKIAGDTGVNGDEVRELLNETREQIVAEAIREAKRASFHTIRIERTDAPTIDVGVQHKHFEHLLKMLSCRLPNGRRLNVWLHGPAGTGKTSAARKVADALSLKFYFTGAIETAYALMGYTDAHGKLVRTPFRDAWEHGGVFLMDEADASSPGALCALNAAIDGSVAAFPDGMIDRHADCVIVAGANTVGMGGDSKYAGRVRQDVAFLSRWSLLEWPLDEKLEEHLAGNDESAKRMLQAVRHMRIAAAQHKIDGASLTTRAILDGSAMLRVGLDMRLVLEATVRKGMPLESWKRIAAVTEISGNIN